MPICNRINRIVSHHPISLSAAKCLAFFRQKRAKVFQLVWPLCSIFAKSESKSNQIFHAVGFALRLSPSPSLSSSSHFRRVLCAFCDCRKYGIINNIRFVVALLPPFVFYFAAGKNSFLFILQKRNFRLRRRRRRGWRRWQLAGRLIHSWAQRPPPAHPSPFSPWWPSACKAVAGISCHNFNCV